MADIWNSLISSATGGNSNSTTPVTPENPVNGEVWTSGKNAVPNPFFAAMNQQTVQNIQMAANGNIGGILASRGKISGSTATIINATLDYFMTGTKAATQNIPQSLANRQYTANFIPIILKTEFNYMGNSPSKIPLYIIFDSTPENISFQKNAQWNGKPMLGRPEPIYTYENSSATTVTITGDFFVDSADEHIYKLKVSDYLMALATPSRDNFMPSPIQVIIGEWKNFRAIVNSVTVDFKGPWIVAQTQSAQQTDADTKAKATAQAGAKRYLDNNANFTGLTLAEIEANTATVQAGADNAKAAPVPAIPSHAPYFFTATLSLTLVSKENEVKYAEDIIANADKSEINPISTTDIAAIDDIVSVYGESQTTMSSGAFTLGQSNSGYSYTNGVLTANSTYKVSANSAYKPGNGDNDRQSGDLTTITRAVSDKLSAVIKKKL